MGVSPRRNAFSEVQTLLAADHPGMEVTPSYYPVPPARKAAVNALSVLQYGAMAAVLFVDAVAELLRTRLGVQVRTSFVCIVCSRGPLCTMCFMTCRHDDDPPDATTAEPRQRTASMGI